MENPKLRQDIQIIPYQDEEYGMGILIRDSIIDDRTMVMSESAVVLLAMMDGTNSIRDIQAEIMRKSGQLINTEDIQAFVNTLDEQFLLDNDTYQDKIKVIYQTYKTEPVRPTLMAGNSYPADKTELKTYLDEVFAQANDVDLPANRPANVKGIIAPHIDIERGQNTYAKTYYTLKQYKPAKTYVVLGVNHQYPTPNPFVATDRDYETPLGRLKVDTDLLNELNAQVDWDLFEGELAHRGEHSVEFPALFLSYIYPDSDLQIVPILANYIDKRDPKIEMFINALTHSLAKRDDVVLIASVDFSHIGPKFGWQRQVTDADTSSVEREDLQTIKLMQNNDPEGFYQDIMKDANRRNIDALGAGYVFLRAVNRPGHLIQYEQTYDPFDTVTFTGLIF